MNNWIMLKLNNEEAVTLIETIQIAGGNPAFPFKGEVKIVQISDPDDEEKEEFFLQLAPSVNLPKSTRFMRAGELFLTGGLRVAAVIFVILAWQLSDGVSVIQIQPSPPAFILSILAAIILMVYQP